MFKHLDKTNYEDKAILDKHLTKYLDGVSKTILIAELVILLCTAIIALIVLNGFYSYTMNVTLFYVPVKVYFIEQFIHKLIAWTILGLYFIFYKKVSLEKRKKMLCALTIVLTFLLTFGSWNVNYFGFLFIIPVIIASPMNKKTNRIVFGICVFMNILYTLFQITLRQERYNYIIGIVTTTVIISFYFFSLRLHKTMYNALLDVKEYSSLSKELYEEVAHDYLTNALSVSALHKDVDEDNNYRSLAFLDIDNFKGINDKYGHDFGDKILKLIVNVVQLNEGRIYRYGGDEFVILSELTAQELAEKLETIKTEFTDGAQDQYSCKATISVGVINIVGKEKLFDYLKQCDKLMYISKNSGKNKITVEEK